MYQASENGIAEISDPSLKDKIAELTATRDQAQADIARLQATSSKNKPAVTAPAIKQLTRAARAKIKSKDTGFRRDYIRALAGRIDITSGKYVRITASRASLLQTLSAASGRETAVPGVTSFIPKWRTRHDSNVWPLPSEGSALSS